MTYLGHLPRHLAVPDPNVKDSDSKVKSLYQTEFMCKDGTVDEAGAEHFRIKIQPRIFKAVDTSDIQGAKPKWEASPSEKIVEYQRCGSRWLLTWKEIGGLNIIGDPFVLLMTVPLSDVTEAPDRIEEEIKDDIAMQAGLGALIFYRGSHHML